MEYRRLGNSGLKVSALSFGTATFGGTTEFSRAWGGTGLEEATLLVNLAVDAGINLFDTADVYSDGASEEVLGQAIGNHRDKILIATKACFRTEAGPNGMGTSRHHLIRACEASLRRLGTDYIDLYQLHTFDAMTPIDETLRVMEELIRAGKVRYIGCSNFSGWHLMKSLALASQYGLPRYVAHQAYYSLAGREYEWELMPLAVDQQVGTVVWSPLAGARLTGKIRRNQPLPQGSRSQANVPFGPPVEDEYLFRVVDALEEVAKEAGKSIPQVALNWLLQRPTVSTIVLGARNQMQLKDNLGAVGWKLTAEQITKLDRASERVPIYPYWHQRETFAERNPPEV